MSHASDSLAGLKLVDLGLGMAAALVVKLMRELGAAVTRVEPAGGDPFHRTLPAYATWHAGKRLVRSASPLVADELAGADLCVVGGEDVPGLAWRPDANALLQRHPHLVILSLDGYPASPDPAAEVLIAARSGAVFEHFTDRPVLTPMPVATYGQVAQGAIALLAALLQRRRTGRGQVARASLYGGALMWNVSAWMSAQKTDLAYHTFMPKDARQLIFRCGDGVHVQVTMGVPGAKDRFYAILKLAGATPGAAGDRALPSVKADPKNFFGEIDPLQKAIAPWHSAELLAALAQAGIPAEPLLSPGQCWDDPQVRHNGLIVRSADGTRHVGLPLSLQAGEAPWTAPPAGDAPLAGVRVLDLGTVIAGPYTSVLLRDLGAEVVRVEALTGDIIRVFARWFASVSRGKQCIAADFKSPEAIEVVRRLAARADVVHHNFRPGVAERLGIGPAQLRAANPKLVALETFGYGSDGPKAQAPGFDMIFQALCGHELRGGGEAHPPLWYRAAVVDFMAGAIGAIGVLAALLHPRGAGATVRTSLLDSGTFLMSELVQTADGAFRGAPPADAHQLGAVPAERLYAVRDGWIAVAVRGEAMARAFARTFGISLKIDPSAWTAADAAVIASALAPRDLASVTTSLRAAGIWHEPCRRDVETQLLHSDATGDVAPFRLRGRTARYGEVVQVGPLFEIAGCRLPAEGRWSELGEDTDRVLAELGYDAAAIVRLREGKAVR